jgi:hypothetical protein
MQYISSLNDPFNPQFKKDIMDLIEKMIREDKREARKTVNEISAKQKILILHYLGIIPKINLANTKKALLLSMLLNLNEQNLRGYLTYVGAKKIKDSDIKTVDNLRAVHKIFEKLGLIDELVLVNKDLAAIVKTLADKDLKASNKIG